MADEEPEQLLLLEDEDTDASSSYSQRHVSHQLFEYIEQAPLEQHDSVIKEIQSYIEAGADLNYSWRQAGGGSIMHKVAVHWDKALTGLVHNKFIKSPGQTLNIDVVNNFGRTPLHEAVRFANLDMVEWLIEHGANLEMKTMREHQTPLHYAVRFDSIEALEILLNAGADVESRDYKSRTPLLVAINMGRQAAANYLLSLPTPPEVRVSDIDGNMAMSAMIRTMPRVACKALDQLHQIDDAKRKESFLLAYLEPKYEEQQRGIRTPYSIAVAEKRRGVLFHPVMQALTRTKWKFTRPFFYCHFILYIIFLLLWSVLIMFPTVKEQHFYKLPQDLWRIICSFVMLAIFAIFLVDDVLSFCTSTLKHKKYFEERAKVPSDDWNTLIIDEDEEFFLKHKLTIVDYVPSHFRDFFSYISIISNILTIVVIVMHVNDVMRHTPNLALWTARVACCNTVLLWIRLIQYLRALKFLGPLIAVYATIIDDIFRYFALGMVFFIPYVICFWVMFGGAQSASLTGSAKKDLSTVYRVAVMTFRMMLVDSYPYDEMRSLDEVMTLLLVVPFLLFMAVIALNLFIALLSSTFQNVQDHAREYALLEQATLISIYEDKLFCRWCYKFYDNHIRNNCNPLVINRVTFDEDDLNRPQSKVRNLERKLNTDMSLLRQELANAKRISLQKEASSHTKIKEPHTSFSSVFEEEKSEVRHQTVRMTSRRPRKSDAEIEWQRKITSVKQ